VFALFIFVLCVLMFQKEDIMTSAATMMMDDGCESYLSEKICVNFTIDVCRRRFIRLNNMSTHYYYIFY
jgi:hypothetical protein